MYRRLVLTLLSIASLGLAACSTQNRTAAPQISSEQLVGLFDEIAQSAGVSGFSTVEAGSLETLMQDATSTIYHVGSDSDRPAVSVLSLNDVGFIDPVLNEQKLSVLDIDMRYADVIFVDGMLAENDRRFALMMRLESYDGSVLYFNSMSEAGDYKFTDSAFETRVRGANGESLILKSSDVSPDYNNELNSAIKLEIWIEENGQQYYLGQVSTMSGFGGF